VSLARRSKRRVEAHLERLRETYGSFEKVETTWALSSGGYEATVERFEAGTVGGAGVWITDDDGKVLLVRQDGEDGWSEPAGKVEPGETLAEAARREVAEETGVTCTVEGVHVAQVIETTCADDPDQPPVYRLVVTFAGSYVSGDLEPEEGEITGVRWWDEHPDELLYEGIADLPVPAADD
jgi:ADP-ribose pyrophosphatase YjhB (NUDIX family)